MKSYCGNPLVRRAQPWLGTLVTISAGGLSPARAHEAIDAAFAEIATVHRRMSFHERNSDVSRLNRTASAEPVAVHFYTAEVLRWALVISAASEGCFDISVAPELVKIGLLPRPEKAAPHPRGAWRDIELLEDGRVVFHRPLWIDLGGIAKGYAVDRATERLRQSGAREIVVNAGGDIRVSGARAERIALGIETLCEALPVLELTDGSVASSSGSVTRGRRGGRSCGPHIHGRRRTPASTNRFASVLAERCVVADALTKVVMAEGASSVNVLRQFGAVAHFYDPAKGWQHLNGDE